MLAADPRSVYLFVISGIVIDNHTVFGRASYRFLQRPAADAAALVCVLAVATIVRLAAWRLGLSPDPDVVVHHWQHLPLGRLAEDWAGSIAGLRSQPPLWNAVLGTAAVACDAGLACVTGAIHAVNVGLSVAAAASLYAALRIIGSGPAVSSVIVAAALSTPTVLFFETYPFYPHLTAAAVALAMAGAAAVTRYGSTAGFAAAMGGIAILALTATLWHPLVMLPLAALLIAALPARRRRRAVVIAAVAAALAAVPVVRNAALTGHASAGTWLGLNLVQVAPGLGPDAAAFCSFGRLLVDGGLGTGPLEGEILNRPYVADVSRACATIALRAIAAAPGPYLRDVVRRMAQSHLRMPYHYFFAPVGFTSVPHVAPPDGLVRPDGGIDGTSLVLLGLNAVGHGAVVLAGLALVLLRRRTAEGRLAAFALTVIVWGALVSHAANGGEQQRMRYTVEPAYLVLAVLLARQASRALRPAGAGRGPVPAGPNPVPEVLRLAPRPVTQSPGGSTPGVGSV
jgi:hypothetical protein